MIFVAVRGGPALVRAACEANPPVTVTFGTLCGRALLSNGQFANATVTLVDTSGTTVGKTRTDAKGWFALSTVPAAIYTVKATDASANELHISSTVDMRDANTRTCAAPVTVHFGTQDCDGMIEGSSSPQ